MLSTHEAVAAFFVDPVADQLTQATLSAAKELLTLEIHAPVPLPGGNLTLPGSRAAADDGKVQTGFAAQGLVRPLTLRRMERIMQRVRSMLCRLADAADDGAALSSLRKQVSEGSLAIWQLPSWQSETVSSNAHALCDSVTSLCCVGRLCLASRGLPGACR